VLGYEKELVRAPSFMKQADVLF